MVTVKELQEQISKITPKYSLLTVDELEYVPVSGDGLTDGILRKSTGEMLAFGEEGFANFSSFLGAPASFMKNKLTGAMKKDIFDHLSSKLVGHEATMVHIDGSFQNILTADKLILPPDQVVEMISKVFQPEDVISKIDLRNGMVVSVRTGTVESAIKVGDITQGGVRFETIYGKSPNVSAYLERLVCRNGMVATSDLDQIPLKGYTLAEVLSSMQAMADHYLTSSIPNYLDNWKKMTSITTTNAEQLIHRLSKEAGLSTKIESRIIEAAASLEDSSYFDVVNLITSFQHEEGVDTTQFNKLQQLGGNAIRDLGGHRCNNCQHNLDA